MTRRDYLLSFVLLCGCSPARRQAAELLPENIDGWRRGAVIPAAHIPQVVSSLGLEDSAQSAYTRDGVVQIQLFRMRAETSAFELIQKWRQTDGLAVYKGHYFVVARQDGASDDAAKSLLRSLQQSLP